MASIKNDAELVSRVQKSVLIEMEKRKAMNAPIVRYSRKTGEVLHEMPDGKIKKVRDGSARGRYSERNK